jgi:hypothetical protein
MKNIFVFILFQISNFGYSQYPDENEKIIKYPKDYNYLNIPIIKDTIKKIGIYIDIEEFRNNSPSINLTQKISYRNEKYSVGLFETPIFLLSYKINVTKDESRSIGNVFGFCDGKNIYLANTGSTYENIEDYNFGELEYLGRYCFYKSLGICDGYYSPIRCEVLNVLDLITGEINPLTKGLLKNILKDKPDLLKKFKNDQNKSENLKNYLIEYLKT